MTILRRYGHWGISLLIVLLVHFGFAFWSLFWRAEALPPAAMPAPAMMLELAPLPEAPTPAPPQPEPEPAAEPEPEIEQPKRVEAPKPEIELPPPPPPKPKPKPKPKPPEPKKPEPKPAQGPAPERKPAEEVPQAQPSPQARAPELAAAHSASGQAAQGQINWEGLLLGHLNRHKRYPHDARQRGQEGTVKVRMVVDANGRVLNQQIVNGSGNRSLDRATLQMIKRAQPLPPPPPEMLKNGSLEVIAPFVYSLERG